jgi:hypothetical protein
MATLQTPSVEMRAHRNAEDDLFALTLMTPPPIAMPPGVAALGASGVPPRPHVLVIACGAAVPAARAWLGLPAATLSAKERVHPPVRVETVPAAGAAPSVALLSVPASADGDAAVAWLYAALDALAPRSVLIADVRDPPVSVLALPVPPPVAYGLTTGGAAPATAEGDLPALPPPLMLDGAAAVAFTWALGGAAGVGGAVPAAAVRTFASPFELNHAGTALAIAGGLARGAAALAAAGGEVVAAAAALPTPPGPSHASRDDAGSGGGVAGGAARVFLDAVKAEWRVNPAVAAAGGGSSGAAPGGGGGAGAGGVSVQPMRVAGESVAASGMYT